MLRHFKKGSGSFLFLCAAAAVIAVLGACSSQPEFSGTGTDSRFVREYVRNGIIPEIWEWQSVQSGVDYAYFRNDSLPVRWHLVRIDLRTPGLELVSYPHERHFSQNGTFAGQTVQQFAADTDALVAVNATPFSYAPTRFGSRRKLTGLYAVEGVQLSEPIEKYAALLLIRTEGRLEACVLPHQTETLPERTEYAFGGFFAILSDSRIREFAYHSLDSRTAAGVSADKSVLYLLCVEGERKRSSRGLTYEECAYLLRAAGAADAMQLDGGGSAAIAISGIKTMSYPVKRHSANIFGFKVTFPQNSD